MKYKVKFQFTCFSHRSTASRKSGDCEITSDATVDELKNSNTLKNLIAADMAKKTKQTILEVDVKEITAKKRKCGDCNGTGLYFGTDCNKCDGEGML